ncbi:hypothetical protein V6N13_094067 [Hibiscus sabdariffa]
MAMVGLEKLDALSGLLSVSKVGATTAHSSMCVYGVSVASNNGSSQNCMDLEEGMAIDMGGSATGMAKASYVAALSRSSCVNPRNLMVLGDEVEIALQTGDVVADHSDSFPVIKFSGRLHNIMDRNMRQAIVVRLLRRSISYRGLWNKIQAWWKPSGRVQLRRDFSMVQNHPAKVMIWVRLSGLSYQYYTKVLFRQIVDIFGDVIKVDYNTTGGDHDPINVEDNVEDPMKNDMQGNASSQNWSSSMETRGDASLELRMHLKCFIKDNVKSLLALLETRISGNKADSVDFISLEIEVITTQFIHYHIFSSCISMPVFVTIVYESPNIFYQNFPWKKLEAINPGENAPWILKGDFNSLLDEDERIGGVRGQYRVSRSFHDFNFRTGLIDGGFQGPNLLGLMVISNNV